MKGLTKWLIYGQKKTGKSQNTRRFCFGSWSWVWSWFRFLVIIKKTTMKKKILDIDLSKDGLNIFLKIKASPEIEKFFKSVAVDDIAGVIGGVYQEKSNKWVDDRGVGLQFYIKAKKLNDKVAGVDVIDNFGNGLFNENKEKINVALLRAVGITDGIVFRTTDLLGYEEMKAYIEKLAVWTKGFYREHLKENTIKASLSFEV